MTAELLAGAPVAEAVLADVKARVDALRERGVTPGLGTILVGDDGPSANYVRKKHEACEAVGMASFHLGIEAGAGQQALLDAVDRFNDDPAVDAYLIQLPVAPGFDSNAALMRMDAAKDADGLHPTNLGKLVLQDDGPVPCTPAGIQAILQHYGIDIAGREVCIVGRGPTLGRPLSLLLTLKAAGANAAVTVVHTGVPNLADYTRRADIVVAAVGVPGIVREEMVKPGATVLDVGLTRTEDGIRGDVDPAVADVAGLLTPMPGGVGPMTIAMLLRSAVKAARYRRRILAYPML
jgi:methylenetetrahydrofolate dehydrogenase (NADP+)/methenyltetrahydrofolate cyclohydrolase